MSINCILSNFQELTSEQESNLERNIVWLFGGPRSGTSWLALQLLSFQTNSIDELHIEEHLSMPAMEYKDRFVRRIDNPQKSPNYFFSEKYKDTWMHFLKKLILNRIYAQTKDLSRKTIIKEVCSFGSTDILSDCLSNSKIIILLRDGRDVIDSLYDARGEEGFMTKNLDLKPILNKHEFLKEKSQKWVIRTENFLKAFENHAEGLRYMIRYEDLRKDTLTELEKLYRFLKIDIPKEELQEIVTKYSFENIPTEDKGKGKFARSATSENWKNNFTEEEKGLTNSIMGDLLKKLGYPLD